MAQLHTSVSSFSQWESHLNRWLSSTLQFPASPCGSLISIVDSAPHFSFQLLPVGVSSQSLAQLHTSGSSFSLWESHLNRWLSSTLQFPASPCGSLISIVGSAPHFSFQLLPVGVSSQSLTQLHTSGSSFSLWESHLNRWLSSTLQVPASPCGSLISIVDSAPHFSFQLLPVGVSSQSLAQLHTSVSSFSLWESHLNRWLSSTLQFPASPCGSLISIVGSAPHFSFQLLPVGVSSQSLTQLHTSGSSFSLWGSQPESFWTRKRPPKVESFFLNCTAENRAIIQYAGNTFLAQT